MIEGTSDRRFHRGAGQHGFRPGATRRTGNSYDLFAPTRSTFAKLLESYPPGRKRSAVVPMLIYAQDEVGAITQELIDEVAKRCGVTAAAGG